MERSLIIHPKDDTTQFLDIVYNPIPNKTIITGGVTLDEVNKLIEEHDRVIMCGHGSPIGLFSVGQFITRKGYVISDSTIDVLKKKNNSICEIPQPQRFLFGNVYFRTLRSDVL